MAGIHHELSLFLARVLCTPNENSIVNFINNNLITLLTSSSVLGTEVSSLSKFNILWNKPDKRTPVSLKARIVEVCIKMYQNSQLKYILI